MGYSLREVITQVKQHKQSLIKQRNDALARAKGKPEQTKHFIDAAVAELSEKFVSDLLNVLKEVDKL